MMSDIDGEGELAELAREIQNGDIVLTLAQEIQQRRALETLVASLLDRLSTLETRMRQHHLFHNHVS